MKKIECEWGSTRGATGLETDVKTMFHKHIYFIATIFVKFHPIL